MQCALYSYHYIHTLSMKAVPRNDSYFVWSARTHKYHSERIKEGVFELLLIFRRLAYLPRDVRFMLLESIVEGSWKKKR